MFRSSLAIFFALALSPGALRAQFAEPPGPYEPTGPRGFDEPDPADPYPIHEPDRDSSVRFQVGPALRISDQEPGGGLSTAVDIGRGAAGLRLGAAWVRSLDSAEASRAAQYSAELWLDLSQHEPWSDERWRALVGAGAGWAIVASRTADGVIAERSIGVGILRGGVQYRLPITGTDARVSADLAGVLPAIDGSGPQGSAPWAMLAAAVVVGF